MLFVSPPRTERPSFNPQSDYTVRGQSYVWRLPKYWPPPRHRPASVYPPRLVRGEEDTLAVWRGGGGDILEDARHSSVLYICKYSELHPFSLFNQDGWTGLQTFRSHVCWAILRGLFFWNPIRRNMELAKLWLPVRGWGGLGSSQNHLRTFSPNKTFRE